MRILEKSLTPLLVISTQVPQISLYHMNVFKLVLKLRGSVNTKKFRTGEDELKC